MLYIEQIRPELTWRLRRDVLYPEQPLFTMEMDEDKHGYHFGAFQDNELLAVVSLFWKGTDFQFRKFAVVPEAQGQGIGKALLQHVTNFANNENGHRIWCNARITAIDFYAKHGFRQIGTTFIRGGFEYAIMEKMLKN